MPAQIYNLSLIRAARSLKVLMLPQAWCKDIHARHYDFGRRPMARKIDPTRLTENEKAALAFINGREETTVIELKTIFEGNQTLASSVGYTLAKKGRVKKIVKKVKTAWGRDVHLKPLAYYYPLNKG